MKRLRLRIILLAFWTILFYTLFTLLRPYHLSPIVASVVPILIIAILAIPQIGKVSIWVTIIVPVIIFLAIEVWMGQSVSLNTIPLLITELCMILVSALLTYWLGNAIAEFENAVAHITISHKGKVIELASLGTTEIYREIKRARNHSRPLTLLAISVDEGSIEGAISRMVQEAQRSMIKKYTLANICSTLCEKLEESDIVVQMNGYSLVVLPEVKPDHLPSLVKRLRQQVTEQVGVEIQVGSASLPQDGFTYEGLLDKAITELKAQNAPDQPEPAKELVGKVQNN